ncbi:hypothetical protein OKZ62_004154 [Vibrio navarrensis]|nr:hypothetical protein [Vibrio navarrensis]
MNILTCKELINDECIEPQLIASNIVEFGDAAVALAAVTPYMALMLIGAYIIKKARATI